MLLHGRYCHDEKACGLAEHLAQAFADAPERALLNHDFIRLFDFDVDDGHGVFPWYQDGTRFYARRNSLQLFRSILLPFSPCPPFPTKRTSWLSELEWPAFAPRSNSLLRD